MLNLWRDEPVRITAAVSAVLNLVATFGLDLSGEQIAGINLAVAAVLGLFIRNRVTPSSGPDLFSDV